MALWHVDKYRERGLEQWQQEVMYEMVRKECELQDQNLRPLVDIAMEEVERKRALDEERKASSRATKSSGFAAWLKARD